MRFCLSLLLYLLDQLALSFGSLLVTGSLEILPFAHRAAHFRIAKLVSLPHCFCYLHSTEELKHGHKLDSVTLESTLVEASSGPVFSFLFRGFGGFLKAPDIA